MRGRSDNFRGEGSRISYQERDRKDRREGGEEDRKRREKEKRQKTKQGQTTRGGGDKPCGLRSEKVRQTACSLTWPEISAQIPGPLLCFGSSSGLASLVTGSAFEVRPRHPKRRGTAGLLVLAKRLCSVIPCHRQPTGVPSGLCARAALRI